MTKKCQQEMVGFIIIVVLIMVAGLIFFLISLRQDNSETQSSDLYNFIYSSLVYTTDCAPVVIPQYSSLSDLIKECFDGQSCTNLKKNSCDYLNETIGKILEDFRRTKNDVRGYQLDLLYNSTTELRNLIPSFIYGSCVQGDVFFAEEKIRTQGTDIIIRLRVCKT